MILALLFLSATAQVSISTTSPEERAQIILSQLPGNVFISPNSLDTTRPPTRTPKTRATRRNSGNKRTRTSTGEKSKNQSSRRRIAQVKTIKTMINLQDKIVAQGGCHHSVCFTLDGGLELSAKEQKMQRDFVALIAETLGVDGDVQIAAFEHGSRLLRISALSPNINAFLVKLERWEHIHKRGSNDRYGSYRSGYLSSSIRQCDAAMLKRNQRTGSVSKMVVINKGQESHSRKVDASKAANHFRSHGGGVCAVAFNGMNQNFLAHIAGGRDRVVEIRDPFRFHEVLTQVVKDLCDLR